MAVRGFTTPEAADSIGTSASTSHILSRLAIVYSAHVPFPELKETLLPINFSPSTLPALITFPTPYSPAIKLGSVLQTPSIIILSTGLIVEAISLI